MTQRRRRPTIRDVATQAGVSMTTVSHSLSGKGIVAEATRQRVIETAEKMGYHPNAVASGLRNSKLGIIALVMRPLDTLETFMPEGVDYFLRFAGAASLSALDHGYGLMLISDPTLVGTPRVSLAADAFIVTDPVENDPVIDLLQGEGIPFLTVGKDPARAPYESCLESNTVNITRQVLSHLAEAGAGRVALALGTDRNSWNVDTEAVYREWCAQRGQRPIVMSQRETSGEAGGRALAKEVLSMEPRPDAVYCLTGRHAAGLLLQLQDEGLAVPGDVLVVAGSDSEQTRNSDPPISAVDLEPEALARAAVAALVEQLDGEPKDTPADRRPQDADGPGRFILRGSSTR